MSYPSNFPGSYPVEQPSGYGSYAQWSAESEDGPRVSHRHLTVVVVLLGLCSYLVSFGPMLNMPGLGWEVRFAVLASLLAAFALWAKQPPARSSWPRSPRWAFLMRSPVSLPPQTVANPVGRSGSSW